jgi:hypothetical protein
MVTAKPVVKNKFWILKDEDRKIGTVEKDRGTYIVKIADHQAEFKTIKTIENKTNISFEQFAKQQKKQGYEVNGFLTNSKPYNAVYNVKTRLPIFTKKPKSKSWYAAGYYKINIKGRSKVVWCPKLILLQRYQYMGPVHSPQGFTYR